MTVNKFDVTVIGGGPGGYVAAIRAAQLKARAAIVEEDRFGGVCNNVGCIPTKTMLRAAELVADIERARKFGINAKEVTIDFKQLVKYKEEVVTRLSQGIESILEHHDITIFRGRGVMNGPHKVGISLKNVSETIESKTTIIATGSRPFHPPIPGINGSKIYSGEDATKIEYVPKRVLIAGGGAEGTEFACIFSRLGSEVTLVEMKPNLLPFEDRELGVRLKQFMSRDGVKVLTNTKVLKIRDDDGEKIVTALSDEAESQLRCDVIVLGLGRKPNTDNLGLEAVGIITERGAIKVNSRMETNLPGVYAIGDVVGGYFAHEAMMGGIVAAENAMGGNSTLNRNAIPRCIYTIPEVAAVGMTEEEAGRAGYKVKVGKFLFSANGRAWTLAETDGVVKVVVDSDSNHILGVHMIGPTVSELISEATLAMTVKMPLKDIEWTMHAHPTLSEVFREAILDADGWPMHKMRLGER